MITKNSHCMQEILLEISILKEDYQKALQKLTLFLLSNLVPSNEQIYQKQKGPGTSKEYSSGYKKSSEKLLYWLYIIWPSLMIRYRGFWVIPKITSTNLCKPIHDIIN